MKLTYQGVVYSKKNSKSIITNRRTGKPMIVASKKAKDMTPDGLSPKGASISD